MTAAGTGSSLPNAAPQLSADASARELVEARLEHLLATPAGVPPHLAAALRHALLAPSKRIRPLLVLHVSEPRAAEVTPALDLGCAVEMVHTASLILDDLPCMDDAQMRRQRPTTHMAFGQATAILAAIALLTQAFAVLGQLDGVSDSTKVRLAAELSAAVGGAGLVAGQELDVNGRDSIVAADGIERLNWLKTGVLFVAAARMGAMLRGLPEEEVEAVGLFASHLGLAFQTADDLLDRTATAGEAGKDVGKDGGKTTLVTLFGEQAAQLSYREHLAKAEAALAQTRITPEPLLTMMARLFDRREIRTP
ncbi:MAG: Geranylgeranyl diphosphate synthase, type [Devosia sp.]|jgi:geranylgeranyl diphosphate synthase type II|nr:Geranylgeranyl diphosphate synthase, type [Devosia sp.]